MSNDRVALYYRQFLANVYGQAYFPYTSEQFIDWLDDLHLNHRGGNHANSN